MVVLPPTDPYPEAVDHGELVDGRPNLFSLEGLLRHPDAAAGGVRGVLVTDTFVALIAAGYCYLSWFGVWIDALRPEAGAAGIDSRSLLFSAIHSAAFIVPLTLRRIFPLASHVVVTALYLLPLILPLHTNAVLAVLASLFSLTSLLSDRRSAFLTSGGTLITLVVADLAAGWLVKGTPLATLSLALFDGLMVISIGLAAYALRAERERSAMLVEEAQRLKTLGDARVKIAAARERRRLAAELHDIVAHHVNLMVVHAETGPYHQDLNSAQRAFDLVAGSGRAALGELDRLLGLLRHDVGSSRAPLDPLPTVEEVVDLVEATAQAGQSIDLSRFEIPTRLDPAISASAHRIAQECLTNIIKYADRDRPATLEIYSENHELVIRAHNFVGADAADSGDAGEDRIGHGLDSMGHRVDALEGHLTAGPSGDGHFEVAVRIPLTDAPVDRSAVGAGQTIGTMS